MDKTEDLFNLPSLSSRSIPTIEVALPTPDLTADEDHLSQLSSITDGSEGDKMSELSTIPSLATERPDHTPRVNSISLDEERMPPITEELSLETNDATLRVIFRV